jgi:putative redox protein
MTVPLASPTDANEWVRARIGPSGFRVEINSRRHHLSADEPRPLGGTDAGPTPYELLLASLAGCTAMTLRMYADRKKWPLEAAVIWLRQSRSHEVDCAECVSEPVGMGVIERRVELVGPLSDEQKARLLEIADRCPVKQTLERGIRVSAGSA